MDNVLRQLLVEIGYKDKASAELGKVDKKVDGVKSNIDSLSKKFTKFGDGAAKIGKKLTTSLTLPIAGALTASFNTFVKRETAFAGVLKTVDGAAEELSKIKKELDYMGANTIPVATTELYGIAESAGQLGIKTKDITRFTEVIAKLGATTNLSYDSASSQLAQFASFTQMSIDDIDRLGSTIVELGNNTATTEADIVNFAMRIGAAGRQVGMTHSEIMGMAAGMSSLGLEAEGGGTAVSKLMLDMLVATKTGGKQLNKYAKVTKMTGSEFKKAFEDNAAGALVAFTQGLGDLEKQGANIIGILDDMGLSEVRVRDAILRTTGAGDRLNETLKLGNNAWKENNALNKEFSNISGTAAANLQYAKNTLGDIGEELGKNVLPYVNKGLDKFNEWAKKFGELSETQKSGVVKIAIGLAALGPVMKFIGTLSTGIGSIIGLMGKVGLAGAIGKAGAAIAAFATGPVGIAIGAVAALAAGIYVLYKNWDKVKDIGNKAWTNTKDFFTGKSRMSTEDYIKSYQGSNRAVYSKIGRNALGTNYWKGGLTHIAERGPELVVNKGIANVPKGSKVINTRDTEEIFKGSSRSVIDQGDNISIINNFEVTLANGSSDEISRVKREIQKQFEPWLEDYFYKLKLKRLRTT